jgi:uncharacterized membrane protein
MDSLEVVDIVSRIVHLLTAITLVGGSLFVATVLGPSLRSLSDAVSSDLWGAINGRWKMWVHGGIALFLITGFYNYIRAMPLHKGDGLYHALVGTKILLALGVMVIASGLVGRSKAFQFMRDARGLWQAVLILLAVVIVAISGFVKVRGIPVIE